MTEELGGGLEELPPEIRAIVQLHRAGWTSSEHRETDPDGRPIWVVTACKGEERIRTYGPSQVAAWVKAVRKARRPEPESS